MKKNQSSKTAMGIAFIRAMESSKSKEEQICYDPFARSFINDVTYYP
jgi:O-methyltransferase involved in polyketide biosynthesis